VFATELTSFLPAKSQNTSIRLRTRVCSLRVDFRSWAASIRACLASWIFSAAFFTSSLFLARRLDLDSVVLV
jgi:hypothetical protein